MYGWLTRHDGVIVFITSDRSRFTLDTHRSEAWIGGSLRQFHNQRVTDPLCLLSNDPMASHIILIIDYIPPLLVRSGWDNGSIEWASQQWCVFLCTCLKSNTLSKRGMAIYGVALYSWLVAYVCEIRDWPELFVSVYRVHALWTWWRIDIMASN